MNPLATRDPIAEQAFLGRGWGYPVSLDQNQNDIDLVASDEDIRQAIIIILSTSPGERVMRPDFGAGLNALLFQPMNTTTLALAKHHVEEALIRWEPRIDLQNVTVDGGVDSPALKISIGYTVRATNTFYNLVFPFYLLEGRSE